MRIYTIGLTCGEKYPMEPPQVRFLSKVNMHCVDQTNGRVETSKLEILRSWRHECNIESVLLGLKQEMASHVNRKLPQPPEGSTY